MPCAQHLYWMTAWPILFVPDGIILETLFLSLSTIAAYSHYVLQCLVVCIVSIRLPKFVAFLQQGLHLFQTELPHGYEQPRRPVGILLPHELGAQVHV